MILRAKEKQNQLTYSVENYTDFPKLKLPWNMLMQQHRGWHILMAKIFNHNPGPVCKAVFPLLAANLLLVSTGD